MKFLKILSLILLLVPVKSAKSQGGATNRMIEQKVDSVLKLMNLDEKVGQLVQHTGFWEFTGPVPEGDRASTEMEKIKSGRIGSMLNVVGAKSTYNAQKMAVENSRLGIPLLFGYDVIHGFKTMFPIPLAESASWDLDYIRLSAQIAAKESAVSGVNWTFAPMMDISRDPRWGRGMEGSGEDPYLASMISVARVKGFQSDNLANRFSIAATAKHFAAYGFIEAGREYNTVEISNHTLYNIVLPPFKAAVEAGVASVMNSFNDFWGIPATANSFLQRDLLKGKWGFYGLVVSDWGSIAEILEHGYAEDLSDAAKIALTAGSDVDMESAAYETKLKSLVEKGVVSIDLLDDAVRRVLRVKFALGLFDDPYKYGNAEEEQQILLSDEHLKASREVAKRSIILLKNDTNLLPINAQKKQRIAVIGKLADDKDSPLGNWRAKAVSNSAVSLLEGLKENSGSNLTITSEKGYELTSGDRIFSINLTFANDDGSGFKNAISLAKKSDLVLYVMGEDALQSGEGRSQVDISLKGRQVELLKKVLEVNKNVVVILMNGRPVIEPWIYENAPSILEVWHLGSQAGNAIADVLLGKYNPSGKLPVTIPRHVGQIPIYYNYLQNGRPYDKNRDPKFVFWSHYNDEKNSPQYPFGYGLSYTSFTYSDMKLEQESMDLSDTVKVHVTITNNGDYDGEEIVQLYIRDVVAKPMRPVKELRGFKKISLKKGQSEQVSFEITEKTLGSYGFDGNYSTKPGLFYIMIGSNSEDVQLKELTIK